MGKPIAVAGDVFAGFFSLGVRQAGFDVPYHLEHCDYGNKTARLNFPDTKFQVGMENWAPDKIYQELGPIDLMFTNPPCASWSAAGVSRKCGRCNDPAEKWKDDPRTQWSLHLADAGRAMHTRTWIWESVTNAWKYGRSFVDQQAKDWMNAGYGVTVLLQNNHYLGAPQNRKRMFFIAHQHPLVWPDFTMNTPTIKDYLKGRVACEGEVPGCKFKYPGYDLLWEISTKEKNFANFNSLYHTVLTPEQKAQIKTIPGFTVKSLHPERKALVLNDRVVHPYEPRFLSLFEIMLLSGIPYDWKVCNKFGPAALEMSRTVLPPVGKWIATAVKDGLGLHRIKPHYMLVDTLKGTFVTTELSLS